MYKQSRTPRTNSCGSRFGLSSRLISLLLTVSMVFTFLPTAAFASADYSLMDASTFPDENFREYLKQFDLDNSGSLSQAEVSQVTAIAVDHKSIASLDGIEVFTSLTNLSCSFNTLTSLDVSMNTALQTLSCYSSNLTSLNVSGCTALKLLGCANNKLTSLDVSKNTALETLDCYDNSSLTSLDVSGCKVLKYLNCYNNNLVSLDVSGCMALEELQCGSDNLTSLDVSGCTALARLHCSGGSLTSLDLSKNIALKTLFCSDNSLTSLDVSNCMILEFLDCSGNNLTSLNISGCTTLESLDCSDNKLASLDVSSCTGLESLSCKENSLTALDASGCTALEELYCSENSLTTLDVSRCTALEELYCSENSLTTLDVSSCTALKWLSCHENSLTTLDVSGCTALYSLDCMLNNLTTLDINGCTALNRLYCSGNNLTELNVSGCPTLKYLYCHENNLTSLEVSGCAALEELYCNNNNLTSLDLSNTKVHRLEVSMTPYTLSSCVEKLDDLPGSFDLTKASNWTGGTVADGVLILDADNATGKVSYTYDAGNGNTAQCTLIVPESAHTWDGGKVTKPATATETGVMTYICTVCGTTKTETIDKLPTPEVKAYTITVYGGKAYSDASYEHEITSAKDGDTVWVKADNRAFEGWVSEGDTRVTFDKSDATDTWFHMPAGNVVIRAAGDAAPAPSGGGGGGAGILILGVGAVALIGGAIAVVMMMPVTINGHVVHAENKAVIPNATIQLKQNDAVITTTTASADGSFSLSAKGGEYDVIVTWTDEEGSSHTGTTHISISAFGTTSGINIEV